MSGKSRRGRHSAQTRKKRSTATSVDQQRVTPGKSAASAPRPSVPTPVATATGAQYSYVVAELRRIGILTGILVAILVVLALVLP